MTQTRLSKVAFFFIVTSLFSLTAIANLTHARGTTMNAESYFSDGQLSAYRLAQEGKTEDLFEAVRAGVDLNRPGKQDLTLLALAVLTADRQAIISLIRAGANPNLVIPDAGSPAILAITKHFNPPRTEAVEALLDAGYDPNQLLSHGTPYLFFFVDYSHWPGLELALQHGGSINAHTKNGESLLSYLIEGGNYRQARRLIEAGADVAAGSKEGDTPLLVIESNIRRGNPSLQQGWREMLEMRQLILSKLPDPKDRRTVFTDIVEEKIRQNP